MLHAVLKSYPIPSMSKDVSQFLLAIIMVCGILILLGMKAISGEAGTALLGGIAGSFFGPSYKPGGTRSTRERTRASDYE